MAAGNTYVAIATQTLGSAVATVTFSSIPGTYTDLVLVMQPAGSSTSQNIGLRFNSDSAGNYSETNIKGNGTTASSSRASSISYINVTDLIGTASTLGEQIGICNIMNYANTTTYKTVITRSGKNVSANPGTESIVAVWRNTAAITTIDVVQSGVVTFSTGSTFTLYGIAAA